ncbi:MAG: hypothetical protein WCP26_16000 [Actinomycetes bacterium]
MSDSDITEPTGAESAEHARRIERTALTIYGAMTLLGVLEAATTKAVVDSTAALIILIVATSLAIVIAHAWSTVVAHRLVDGEEMSTHRVGNELWFAGSFLVPAVLALATVLITGTFTSHDTSILIAQMVLIVFLFIAGITGARRGGASWGRSIAWGIADVAVGLAIVLLKETLSLIAH